MSALAMAILLNGMNRREIARWTAAMIASGERMDFSGAVPADRRQALDRRASATRSRCRSRPLVAACGVAVPQLSGRGLGHTGGTLDKLESIPGWRAALSNEEMLAQLRVRRRGDLRGRATASRRPTRSSTRCATSPARSRRSR